MVVVVVVVVLKSLLGNFTDTQNVQAKLRRRYLIDKPKPG